MLLIKVNSPFIFFFFLFILMRIFLILFIRKFDIIKRKFKLNFLFIFFICFFFEFFKMENERENFWKDVFILFDKENKGRIHFKSIHKYLQSVGIVIEKKEIKNELQNKGYQEKEEYTFDELYNTFSSINTISNEDILNAFQVFDKNGKINKEELKYIMTNLGDKISEEEAEQILSNFKIENGEIDYMEFLNKHNINE